MKALENKGINADRLSAKGFGETSPVADNSTKEGRAQNRRTEFAIIGDKE
jgi:outer membrane protein OmpA-like peptidoglycan-associated protein